MSAPVSSLKAPSIGLFSALVVTVAACLPYLTTVSDYFLQEDFGSVQLFASKPWTTFPRWFTMPWTEHIWGYTPDEIRPFMGLAFQLTALGGAAAPELHHLFNIATHAANALLVLALARRVAGLSPLGAAFAAVLFAVLPVQAESVAWISGRVDSVPAFFYLATVLTFARWRQSAGAAPRLYVWSLVLFFVALFTKQNTITMVATLALYDWLIAERPVRRSWAWLRPYVPFAVMTAGFLALRYVVVGTVIRESRLSAQGAVYFGELFARHLRRVVTGEPGSLSVPDWMAVSILTSGVILAALLPDRGTGRTRTAKVALFFGPLWWLIGIAPVLVAGYESPRHVYLASVAWAMLLGLGFDTLARQRPGSRWRAAVPAGAVALLAVYSWQLEDTVREWNRASAISKRAVARLQREALAAPPGSLLIVGVPIRIWEWGLPFVAKPPFTRTDLTARVHIVAPQRLHCCQAPWLDATKAILREWSARPEHPPIVALYVDPRTGVISRLTDAENPDLRSLVPVLLEIDSAVALDKVLTDLLEDVVGPTGR